MKQMSVYRFLNAIHFQILDYGSTRLAKLSSLNRLVLEGSDLRHLGCSVLQSFQRGLNCTSRQRTPFAPGIAKAQYSKIPSIREEKKWLLITNEMLPTYI